MIKITNEYIDKNPEEPFPKFMEWGIINKENFKSINEVPIKRWDPLSTVVIKKKGFGLRKEIRYSGRFSYISPIRSERPHDYGDDLKEDQDCSKIMGISDIFTSITEGKPIYNKDGSLLRDGSTIIITEDEIRRDNPFTSTPRKIDVLDPSVKAVTLINRYPSMIRVIDPELKNTLEKELPFNSKLSLGINLLTISRNFYPALCFDLIPEDVLAGIFLSMKAAILYSVEEAINNDYYDILISPFFNIGRKVGGSQPRIHSQVYIDLNGDGHGSRLGGYLQAFEEMKECRLCHTSHDEDNRIVLKTKYWTYYATGSPVRNYHLRFYPHEHIRRFANLKPNQIQDLAKTLKLIFSALDELGVERNRNIIFNCCPYGYDADFHLFGDIIPHEIIGGAEMADDMRVARKLPEHTAIEIRNLLNK
ncbi:MAG: hypothetical protein JW891_02930 [Candidatus Lokiarchaeota archaeon]|nr:hypothetical protein [Candidatus Lokiarchaeota archaeon]